MLPLYAVTFYFGSTYLKVSRGLEMTNQIEFTQAVESTLLAIGGKWKLLILAHLVNETRRYSDLRRLIPQITEKMLIQQLRELERDGLVQRTVYPSVPPKVEYSFTEYSRTLCPMLQAIYEWGKLHALRNRDAIEPQIEIEPNLDR
jgi:DNA-binding HxlR family transcriptional regulator